MARSIGGNTTPGATRTAHPVVFGDPPPLGDSFIAIDFEYGPGPLVWLVGICIVGYEKREYVQLWADTPVEERENFRRLANLIAASPSIPVVTWSGTTADLPQAISTANRHALGHGLSTLKARHLDLCEYAKRSIRFPIPNMAFGDVASYFAIPKVSRVQNGLQAQSLYRECLSADDIGRASLKAELLDYNRDDVDAFWAWPEHLKMTTVGNEAPIASPT